MYKQAQDSDIKGNKTQFNQLTLKLFSELTELAVTKYAIAALQYLKQGLINSFVEIHYGSYIRIYTQVGNKCKWMY